MEKYLKTLKCMVNFARIPYNGWGTAKSPET
jgi:hypothetical protein